MRRANFLLILFLSYLVDLVGYKAKCGTFYTSPIAENPNIQSTKILLVSKYMYEQLEVGSPFH